MIFWPNANGISLTKFSSSVSRASIFSFSSPSLSSSSSSVDSGDGGKGGGEGSQQVEGKSGDEGEKQEVDVDVVEMDLTAGGADCKKKLGVFDVVDNAEEVDESEGAGAEAEIGEVVKDEAVEIVFSAGSAESEEAKVREVAAKRGVVEVEGSQAPAGHQRELCGG